MALMTARRRETPVALGVLSLFNYLVFPVAFVQLCPRQISSLLFCAIVLQKDIAVFAVVGYLLTREDEDPDRSPSELAAARV